MRLRLVIYHAASNSEPENGPRIKAYFGLKLIKIVNIRWRHMIIFLRLGKLVTMLRQYNILP